MPWVDIPLILQRKPIKTSEMELFRRKKKEKEDPELNPEEIAETVDAEEVVEEAQEEPEAPEET